MSERASPAYLDSNVFIYLVEGTAPYADVARRILRGSERRLFVTSELTLAEVLAPSGGSHRSLISHRREFMNAIVWNPSVRLFPVTREVLLQSAELRQTTNHKLPDAIHCATAVLTGCRFLVSNDHAMRRLPPSLVWLGVDEETITALFGTEA